MSDKVFANGRAIAGKGTAHMARTFGPTDICKVPPQNIPTPFPNFVLTSKLSSGPTSRTMIGGKPIWTAAGKLSPSEPPHPGVGSGLNSNTYRGAAEAATYSMDVIVEGQGVVRLMDLTFQNDRNTVGIVDLSSGLAAWLEGMEKDAADAVAEAAGEGAQADRSGNPDDANAEDTDACDEDAQEPPPNEETEEQCLLTCVEIADKGGRKPNKEGRLEVVVGDSLVGKAELEGACPDSAHPKWVLTGAGNETKVGTNVELKLPAQSLPVELGATSGQTRTYAPGQQVGAVFGVKFKKLSTWTPRSYALGVSAHEGSPEQFTIKTYPDSEFEGEIDLNPLKTIKNMVDALQSTAKAKPGINRDHEIKLLEGRIGGNCKWAEHTDWRVFFAFQITIGYKPLFGAMVKWYIPLPYIAPIQRAIRKFELGKLEAFLRLNGSIELVGGFGRTRPGGVGGDITLTGKLSADVGLEVAIGKNLIAAEAFGTSGITGEAKARFGGGAFLDLKIEWDGLSVTLKVTTTVWWLTFVETEAKFVLVEPKKLYEKNGIKLLP
jgi:Toxin PAAR-like domain